MPPLNEGTILYMPTALPGISVTEATMLLQRQDQLLKQFPEVQHVFGKIGRAQTPTDPSHFSMAETVVTLKPEDQWRNGHDVGSINRGDGDTTAISGHAQYLVDADSDADRNARHGDPQQSRH